MAKNIIPILIPIFVGIIVLLILGGIFIYYYWLPQTKPECTKNEDCGKDFCQQGRVGCIEVKYFCKVDKKCYSEPQEFPGYVCGEGGKCIKPEKEIVVEETSTRDPYKNTITDYRLKYPEKWQTTEIRYEGISYVKFFDPSGKNKNYFEFWSGFGIPQKLKKLECWKTIREETIKIVDREATKYTFVPLEDKVAECDYPKTAKLVLIEFKKDNIEYVVEFYIFDGNLKLVDNVLSTFWFTGVVVGQMPRWETYENEWYGFRTECPMGWEISTVFPRQIWFHRDFKKDSKEIECNIYFLPAAGKPLNETCVEESKAADFLIGDTLVEGGRGYACPEPDGCPGNIFYRFGPDRKNRCFEIWLTTQTPTTTIIGEEEVSGTQVGIIVPECEAVLNRIISTFRFFSGWY